MESFDQISRLDVWHNNFIWWLLSTKYFSSRYFTYSKCSLFLYTSKKILPSRSACVCVAYGNQSDLWHATGIITSDLNVVLKEKAFMHRITISNKRYPSMKKCEWYKKERLFAYPKYNTKIHQFNLGIMKVQKIKSQVLFHCSVTRY